MGCIIGVLILILACDTQLYHNGNVKCSIYDGISDYNKEVQCSLCDGTNEAITLKIYSNDLMYHKCVIAMNGVEYIRHSLN